MFSRSLNKVWCVNSLSNDVKIELTACGCLQSTIACQPRLPSYKLYPCCLPFVSCPISKLNFCGERRQFKCFCCSWREELMWNLLGDQSVLEQRMTPKWQGKVREPSRSTKSFFPIWGHSLLSTDWSPNKFLAILSP